MNTKEVVEKIEKKVHQVVDDLIQGRCKSKAYVNSQDLLHLLDELKQTLPSSDSE